MNNERILKRELGEITKKYKTEVKINMNLIESNTMLVDKNKLLMYDVKQLEEQNQKYKEKITYIVDLIDKGYSISLERIKSLLIEDN